MTFATLDTTSHVAHSYSMAAGPVSLAEPVSS